MPHLDPQQDRYDTYRFECTCGNMNNITDNAANLHIECRCGVKIFIQKPQTGTRE